MQSKEIIKITSNYRAIIKITRNFELCLIVRPNFERPPIGNNISVSEAVGMTECSSFLSSNELPLSDTDESSITLYSFLCSIG